LSFAKRADWYEWFVGWKTATLAAVLGVVALTVWAAVAAGAVKGPGGVVAGAVLTALAGVSAGYVPLIRDAFKRVRSERAQLDAKEAADREALRLTSELPSESPAGLLDPRRGLVAFTGREHELAGLLAWCQDGSPRGVRLVTGPGGVGKTRLSVELCGRLDPDGWRCVRVGDRQEEFAVATARRGWPGRLLLVVDYAETRIGLSRLLRAVAADAGPVRVLLLARSAGEWWDRLREGEPAVRTLLAKADGDEPLRATVSDELSNADLVRAAVPVFAGALGMSVPERVMVDTEPGVVRVLDLHAAALVAVLQSAGMKEPVRVSVSDVLNELLGHETRFWEGTAQWRGLLAGPTGMDTTSLRHIVAAGALLGAASQDEAVALLRRVPGAVASLQVARWLRELYPPEHRVDHDGAADWLGTLIPDRLAELLVVKELTDSPELAEECLSRLDERQALRAVTLLGRAATDQQEAAEVLLKRVLPLLEKVVAGLPADVGLLTVISDAIPYPSTALAEADLAITRRILDALPAGNPGLQARWLNWLGTALAQTGRFAESLPAKQEAVRIRRELAVGDPGRYRADLAGSLADLGAFFSRLGRQDTAFAFMQEAAEIWRELAAAVPGRYRADLARSLANLGACLRELGRQDSALPVIQEAMRLWRPLAAALPDRYLPDLAGTLLNLGIAFLESGRQPEALAVTQEAVQIYRELARTDLDRHLPDLAHSLTSLGVVFTGLGRQPEAVPVTQEAVRIRRDLADRYPGRYRADLTNSLANLGVAFLESGRQPEALPVTQEAVESYRELASANPDRYRPSLASSLSSLGMVFKDLGRGAEALRAAQEAVEIQRDLTAAYPGRYQADLASSLTNLGIQFSVLGSRAEALLASQEAVGAYRQLASVNPDRYQAALATSLNNLGHRLGELGRASEALSVTQETVKIRRGLAAAHPDRYQADLARSLASLGIHYSELDRPAQALRAEEEALQIWRALAASHPERYRADLAMALSNLGFTFLGLDRPAKTLVMTEEAVEIWRDLAADYPGRHQDDLARSLTNIGITFSMLKRPAETLSVIDEAVQIWRELTAAYPGRYQADLARSLGNIGVAFLMLERAAEALPVTQEAVTIYQQLDAAYPGRYRTELASSVGNLRAAFSMLKRGRG
jgi:tetratricopeptide (TPR) repeat protein